MSTSRGFESLLAHSLFAPCSSCKFCEAAKILPFWTRACPMFYPFASHICSSAWCDLTDSTSLWRIFLRSNTSDTQSTPWLTFPAKHESLIVGFLLTPNLPPLTHWFFFGEPTELQLNAKYLVLHLPRSVFFEPASAVIQFS